MRRTGILAGALLLAVVANAADITWTGVGGDTSWTNGANWSSGQEPAANDNVTISNVYMVTYDRTASSGFPNNPLTINIDGTFELGTIMRNFAVDMYVSSTGSINAGNNWLVLVGGGSELSFDSGAIFNQNAGGSLQIGNNADVTLGFNLSSSGFQKLSSGALLVDGYAGQTIQVDMAAYTGPTQNINLIEFSNGGSMTTADFQSFNLVVTNNSGYPASLVWDDENDIIKLDMGVIEYDVNWDGEAGDSLWGSASNWTGNTLPSNGDIIGIDGATVEAVEFLPGQSEIYLTGASTLTGGLVRAQGSTFYVGSQAELTGGFWDFDNGSAVFEDGASTTMNTLEFKNDNSFTFNLSASGFSALTPGGMNGAGSINSNDSFIVDMEDYTGPAQNITLVDFSSGGGLTDAQFQTANLIVTNKGAYEASLVWDEDTYAIKLDMGVVEYDVTWDGEAGDGLWSNPTNWTGDTLPTAGDVIGIDGSNVTWDTPYTDGFMPNDAALYLTGTAALDAATTWRAGNNTTVYVGPSASFTGSASIVLEPGNFTFEAGATVSLTGNNFMNSGAGLMFNLNADGFPMLQAGNLFLGSTANISNSTFIVDMADFTGAPQNIALIDFSAFADGGSLTDAEFQTATLIVTNDSGYGAGLVWDEATDSIILDMGAVTYDVSWDGEGADDFWSNPTNWTGDTLPGSTDIIGIHNASVDWDSNAGSDNLPFACEIHLTGNSELESTATLRMANSTINVGANATITGSGFWDCDDGTFVFEDGAAATMNFFEFKDANSLSFNLGASGFTTLTPGNLFGAANIGGDDTFTVDLADYTGGSQTITLMDFSNGGGLTDAQFQTANLVITNEGSYTADLEWGAGTASIVLEVLDGDPAPVADDQTVYLSGAAVGITLTATDPDGDPLSWAIVDGPDNGSLSGTAPDLTYTPTGAAVADSFTFTAFDGSSLSNTGTITVLPAVLLTESVSAPDTDVLVSVLPVAPGVDPEAPLLWSTGDAGLGQSFRFASDTTLNAITIQKFGDTSFDSDQHVLKLWIGEYDSDDSIDEGFPATTHSVGATLHTQYIDLSGQNFTSNNYYTITLSSGVSLSADVEYGFELAFTAQDSDNTFNLVKYYDPAESGDGIYAGGMTLYQANITGTLPFVSLIDEAWNDLAFVLQGSSAGGADPIGDITLGGTASGDLVFSWATSVGQTYNVETNADLTTSNWGILETVIGDGGTVTVTNTPALSELFYKITSP